MRSSLVATSTIFLCALRVNADILLSDYSVAAPDSSIAKREYGLQAFANASSQAVVTVAGGAVVLKAKLASNNLDPNTNGYSASVGFLQPLTLDGKETDLSGLTRIDFEYRNSVKIPDQLTVSFGSGLYTNEVVASGTVYEGCVRGAAAMAPRTDWASASLDILDFALPAWWTAPIDFPTISAVLKRTTDIKFSPRTLYTSSGMANGAPCTRCVGPEMTDIVLEIRSVNLVGVDSLRRAVPDQVGCEGVKPSTLLDDFADGDGVSKLGGTWYAYGDSGNSSDVSEMKDKFKGASKVRVKFLPGNASSSGRAEVNASLKKSLGGIWHDFAGWAGVGLDLDGNGWLSGTEALSAISFRIQAAGLGKDIESIQFKAIERADPDSAAYVYEIPAASLRGGSTKTVCVQLKDLNPSTALTETARASIMPGRIGKFRWEARITDQKSQTIDTATANFWITDVRMFGSDAIHGVSRNKPPTPPKMAVQTIRGAVVLTGVQGFDRLEIRAVGGRKIASIARADSGAIPLPQGSYLLVGFWKSVPMSIPFAVVR